MGSQSRQQVRQENDLQGQQQPDAWPANEGPVGRTPEIGDLLRTDSDPPPGGPALQAMLLANAVEYEIIPRLMLAHRLPLECEALAEIEISKISLGDIADFAAMALRSDDTEVRASVLILRDRGVPIESIFMDLLAPVARHLGDMWERDLCTFSEVTLALGRLQKVLRDNSSAFGRQSGTHPNSEGRRILLMPCPGEQHTFGLSMVAEIFHRASWDVITCFLPTDTAAAIVRREWYDVVGFSLGNEAGVTRLREAMGQVREQSQNPLVSIIAGGPLFNLQPEIGAQVPADAIITDGLKAPAMAEKLVATSSLRL
ncbi:B12-binding domain-containing protein [Hydrogenophaga sp.]|uniref:cobalamin B12-binding domain-containing protein n=1 Tax=Hydrogenophaga sp. TaxID=1904254 RepID=UPI0027290791|nr:cobalamin B12-binding domain-containing protein [Hydrogenophaga sp.]MDO8906811.1 cobalamin B12-binding domain-containing protein [Hydrogenophaga sp.]